MDSERRNSFGSKESIDSQRRNSKDNTEYVPTRCRITKPIPPKPAANPMQFVKIGPCELYRKAQEQLKKVEEVKSVRQEIKDDAEDWQANLDNWKSSRRKRQEHIIERVVEVKKFEQQETEKGRRRSKTFNEILQDRNKRSTKLSISLYENDDPNDLSDYGIGLNRGANESGPSKSTEDTSIDNDSLSKVQSHELSTDTEQTQAATNNGNQTESEHEIAINNRVEIRNINVIHSDKEIESIKPKITSDVKESSHVWNENYKQDTSTSTQMESEHYTYESAIQGYRTRVISKTNLNPVLSTSMSLHDLDNKSEDKIESNANIVSISKGNILKRKELFESEKVCELGQLETSASRRLSDDFVNSQSLKERLRSLKKYNEQTNRTTDTRYSVDTFTNTRMCASDSSDIKNNNKNNNATTKLSNDQFVRSRVSMLNNLSSDEPKSVICNNWSNKSTVSERYSSPELDEFVNKLDIIHRSLDNLNDTSNENMSLNRVQSLEGLEYCPSNYPASNSSVELLVLSSQFGDTDREDSGIHTADVSCSVSQADEPVDDPDVSTSVNICLEKSDDFPPSTYVSSQSEDDSAVDAIIQITAPRNIGNSEHFVNNTVYPIEFDGIFVSENFPLNAPRTVMEPPKEKPPPPPVADPDGDPDGDLSDESGLKTLSSTKRIKKEMRMKRSSFLGIDPDDQPEIESTIAKPPDINSFLQKESRLEKQLYKKSQNSYSEAGDSQDSGVELERGRLSSDTWCSSLADTAGATGVAHSRQSSEPCTTNSITSEEDEITKKEREIIEMVEKEEQWRDKSDFSSPSNLNKLGLPSHNLNLDVINSPLTQVQHKSVADYAISEDDDHSEVLRVEHELLQLEREERERQREKMVFSRARMQSKNFLKNKRFSLEDISDSSCQPHPFMYQSDALDYRKSMPELQREAPLTGYAQRPQFSTNVARVPYASPLKQPRPVPRESYERDTFMNRKGSTEDELCPLRSPTSSKAPYPPSRHSTQMLSAAPRPRLVPQDNWIHPKMSADDPREKFNYNQHWLIQEAEQRRISEQQKNAVPSSVQNWKLTRPEKHLPDSVIQTLTQRVQNKVILSERNLPGRRMENVQGHYGLHSVGHALPIHHPHMMMEESQDKMLSVSGKKKCSYCGNELGRGAAMIIESLCLFYHMDCFKCCVCHVQLGDGLMGTDVRVRNNKLHCHNCYSSDDGVKFSCV